MFNSINEQILLKNRPVRKPKKTDFAVVEPLIPEPGEGEILTRTIDLSLDGLLQGKNFSKLIVKVSDDPTATLVH